MDNIEIRSEMNLRISDAKTRTVTGIAVPYEVEAHGEIFARDAVTLEPGAKLFWQHEEPIGLITEGKHTDAGYEITARVSETSLGNDIMTMLRDGVIDKFSVGFQLRNYEIVDGIRRVTDALVREVSAVVFPWYSTAEITAVRNDQNSEDETSSPDNTDNEPVSATIQGETNMENTTPVVPDAAEVRELMDGLAHLERKVSDMENKETAPAGSEYRTAGDFILALAEGKDTAVRTYNGATTADSVTTPIDRDLTLLVENAAPLRQVFSTGVTPSEGMAIYFAQLGGITDGTAAQAAQGDDLGYYEIQVSGKNTTLKTIGSFVEMSIQVITRSTVDFINNTFRGQAIALGNKLNAELIAQYQTTVAAQITANNKVTVATSATYNTWLAAITDAAVKFATLGLPLEYLIVDTATFKELMALQGGDGRPVLLVDGAGTNNVGTISPTGLGGNFAGVRVVAVAQLNVNKSQCAFVNGAALRQYTTANLRLDSTNAINLSSAYSLSTVTAVADEYPSAIVGIVRA
jgi:HK97 family phage prohead protease